MLCGLRFTEMASYASHSEVGDSLNAKKHKLSPLYTRRRPGQGVVIHLMLHISRAALTQPKLCGDVSAAILHAMTKAQHVLSRFNFLGYSKAYYGFKHPVL